MFDFTFIDPDVLILKNNITKFVQSRTKCQIMLAICLFSLIWCSWKLGLVVIAGLLILVMFTSIAENSRKSRNGKYEKQKEKLFRIMDK